MSVFLIVESMDIKKILQNYLSKDPSTENHIHINLIRLQLSLAPTINHIKNQQFAGFLQSYPLHQQLSVLPAVTPI